MARLIRIRAKYRAVAAITEDMCHQSNAATLRESIRGRRRLLDEIEGEQEKLSSSCPTWADRAAEHGPLGAAVRDIQVLIKTIRAMDLRLQDMLCERMARVRAELGSLARTSRAALSYASQPGKLHRIRQAG
jgi:hypothetical protein